LKPEVLLQAAWVVVEMACRSGHLTNRTMLAFALHKALREMDPELKVVYEAGFTVRPERSADLIVWQARDVPTVLVAAEVRFSSENYQLSESDIGRLKAISACRRLAVPNQSQTLGRIGFADMPKDDSFLFGLFAVAENLDFDGLPGEMGAALSVEERARSFLGLGATHVNSTSDPSFVFRGWGEFV